MARHESTANHDQVNRHEGATSSSTARGEERAYTLNHRRTWSNNTNNLENFPSFPQNMYSTNARNTGYLTAHSRPEFREETFLSTRPSLWPNSTFDRGDDGSPVYSRDAAGTYVAPDYAYYNAAAGWPDNSPVWGLAKPLPRIVRQRMRSKHGDDEEEKEETFVEGEEKGDVEAAPWARALDSSADDEDTQIADYQQHEHERRISEGHETGQRRNMSMGSVPRRETRRDTATSARRREPTNRRASSRLEPQASYARRSRLNRQSRECGTISHIDYGVDVPETVPEETRQSNKSKQDGPAQEAQADLEPKQVTNEERLNEQPEFLTKWSYYRHQIRQPLAEYLATTIALTIGFCGNFAQITNPSTAALATSSLTSGLCWAFGSMTAIYVAGGISGAHLNPAISLMLTIFRGFPLMTCLQYILAQLLGALTAAGISFSLYRDAIINLDGSLVRSSTGINFYTQPKAYVSHPTAFFTELVGATILGCAILALGDDTNATPGAGMHAFIIGLLVFVLCTAFSPNTGACLNPIRDFAPRIVASMAGYGREVWTDGEWWWVWGTWAADTTGIMLGALCYDVLVFVGGESPVNWPRRRRRRKETDVLAKIGRKAQMGRAGTRVRKWEREADELRDEPT